MSKKQARPTSTTAPESAQVQAETIQAAQVQVPANEAAPTIETIEAIEQRLTTFLQRTHDLRNRIERALQEADGAMRQADEAYFESCRLDRSGEVDRAHEVLRQIKALRSQAVQLRQSVGAMADELAPLLDEERALRSAAGPFIEEAEAAMRRAQEQRTRALRVHTSIPSHCLADVRDLLGKWRAMMGLPEPAAATAGAQPAARPLPQCPRCKGNYRDCVTRVGADEFACAAPYHGSLVFNSAGRIIEHRAPNVPEPRRRIGAGAA